MANRVSIRIHNQTYRILAEEDESYIQNCAEILDKEMKAAMDGTLLSVSDGAVLEGLLITVNYETTYQGFQEMVDYLAQDSRIASIYEATIEYDEKEDLASGAITLLLYLMDSDQLEYTPPQVNIPETGKDNIFE